MRCGKIVDVDVSEMDNGTDAKCPRCGKIVYAKGVRLGRNNA